MSRYLSILLLIAFGCYDYEDRNKGLSFDLYPTVHFSNLNQVKANNSDSLLIKVHFPARVHDGKTAVTFRTDGGVFYENQKQEYVSSIYRKINDSVFVVATIKAPSDTKPHLITVDIPNVLLMRRLITFQPSYPTSIKLEPSKFALAASFADEISFNATLKALAGVPNEGTTVSFKVADSLDSNNKIHFRELRSTDSQGKASARFSFGSIAYRGKIKVVALTRNSNSQIISDTSYFQLIEPD